MGPATPFTRKVREEMTTSQRRAMLTIGAVAGGLLGAAFLPMAVAFADTYDFTPDITTFAPTQVEGYPPLINEVTGAENWGISDATTNTVRFPDAFTGIDTETTIGSFTNDDFLTNAGLIVLGPNSSFLVPSGTQIDLANFGLGFENEWLDVPSGANSGISDLFITPFGNFEVLGSAFSTLLS
ncbi:MAG TPA: hypothetical protein VGH54_26930 [Mycobacterium sp.]|uniref:hypothetical protein n=1 Tax=Mycobacterium sp. TaxID=1785 RepID=UPI002F3E83A7